LESEHEELLYRQREVREEVRDRVSIPETKVPARQKTPPLSAKERGIMAEDNAEWLRVSERRLEAWSESFRSTPGPHLPEYDVDLSTEVRPVSDWAKLIHEDKFADDAKDLAFKISRNGQLQTIVLFDSSTRIFEDHSKLDLSQWPMPVVHRLVKNAQIVESESQATMDTFTCLTYAMPNPGKTLFLLIETEC
jgi:hypothetical protein